jgi:hypothetical protein
MVDITGEVKRTWDMYVIAYSKVRERHECIELLQQISLCEIGKRGRMQ